MRRLEHKKTSLKWHTRYMALATDVSRWSKHPDFKVGAVAVGDFGQILSTGYNGWPRGVVDEESGREVTNNQGYSFSIHAESNLIYNTNLMGTSLLGSTVYVYPMMPCFECAKALVQVGVEEIVCMKEDLICTGSMNKWIESTKLSEKLFKEVGLKFTRLNN